MYEIKVRSARFWSRVAWITFTTKPPSNVFTAVAALPLDVEIRIGAAASFLELEDASGAALAAITDSGVPVDTAVSGISPDATAIAVEYKVPSTVSPTRELLRSLESTARQAAAGRTGDGKLPVPMTVRHNPGLVSVQEDPQPGDVFGGADLNLASNNNAECTAGFTGSRNGQNGVVTARHCDDLLHFGSNTGWIQFVGVASQTPAGNWIDMQFHRSINSHKSMLSADQPQLLRNSCRRVPHLRRRRQWWTLVLRDWCSGYTHGATFR